MVKQLSMHQFVSLFMVLLADDVIAQTEPASNRAVEEIVVTGSRLSRSVLQSPIPITVLTRDQIDLSGSNNLADALNDLPAFGVPAETPLTSMDGDVEIGLNLIDLRNLGPSRTLVLVNGRRHVAGLQGTSAVDINAIPSELIERVEVITGGASSVYGSEAIAGVVNFITRRDFQGVILNANIGSTEKGDGDTKDVSLTMGSNFAAGRGNVLFNASYNEVGRVLAVDRSASADDRFTNSDGTVTSPSRSAVTGAGTLLYPTSTGGFATVTQAPDGTYTAPLTQDNRYNRHQTMDLQMPLERYVMAGILNFGITDDIELTAETSYSNTKAEGANSPTAVGNFLQLGNGEFQEAFMVPLTNPFVPAEVLATIDPSAAGVDVFLRPVQLGPRTHASDRESFRVAIGLQGPLFEEWRWDAYAQYGNTIDDGRQKNVFHLGRYAESLRVDLDPDGQPRCSSASARAAGCVPYNVFGEGLASDGALQYVQGIAQYDSSISQKVVAATLSGSLLELPAGELLAVGGVEYREEESRLEVDQDTAAGMLSAGIRQNTRGQFNVKEVFGEVSVPLIDQMGPLRSAIVDVAVRLADYSTVGNSASWKLGMNIAMPGGIRLRSVYSEATRAPNVGELFFPQTSMGSTVGDPCDGGGVVSGLTAESAQRRIANCLALGLDSSFVADQLSLESVFGLSGGNPGLDEEVAETVTAGLVFAPEHLAGLQASVDYWRINVKDAIDSIARQTVVDQCVDQPTVQNQFCDNVTRDLASNQIRFVNSFIQNLAEETVSGVDVEAAYNWDLPSGSVVGVTLLATRLLEDDIQEFAGATTIDRRNLVGHPEWKLLSMLSYGGKRWSTSMSARYIDSAVKDKNVDTAANVVDSEWYVDGRMDYKLKESLVASFGILNLFDTDPPLLTSPLPVSEFASNTAPHIYDPIGRRFYIGLRATF